MKASSWSRFGEKYNTSSGQSMTLGVVQAAFDQFWFPKIDQMLSDEQVERPLKILALACGTGAEIGVLCSRYDSSRVTILATDYAEGMVEAAKETVNRIGAQDRVNVQVMNAMIIEYPDASFDIVTLIFGPILMPNPSQVFNEIKRVLKSKGWSAYLTPGRMDTHDILIISKKKKSWLNQNRSNDFCDFYKMPMMLDWGTPEALMRKLEAADFSSVCARHIESHLSIERGQGIDEMLNRLYEHPGMSQL